MWSCAHRCTRKFSLRGCFKCHIDSVKCITDSDRVYYSSAIAGFTIGVTLKPGASEHLSLLIKAKEDEDAIEEQKQKLKGTKSSKKVASSTT
jgi:hypothetical protein